MSHLLFSVQRKVDDMGHAPRDLLHNINAISQDTYHKMRALNPLFNAMSNVAQGLETKSKSLRDRCERERYKESAIEEEADEFKNHSVLAISELIALGIGLWKKYQNKR